MNDPQWTAVDDYISGALLRTDSALDDTLRAGAAAGLPPINVTPAQGCMLQLLARSIGARNILEVGTLGGYSTIWLARALPAEGRLITLELEPAHAEVARSCIADAGLTEVVDVRCGPALDLLPVLSQEGLPPFDFTFVDADKASCADYFDWAVRLSRPGSVIVVDNVVRNGALVDASSDDPNVRGVRRLHEMLRSDRRVNATTIQTVGSKGYDGFTLAMVN